MAAIFGLGSSEPVVLIVVIGVWLLLFLALRNLMCWYFKINDLVDIQKRQLLLLTALLESEQLDGAAKSDFIKKSLDSIQGLA